MSNRIDIELRYALQCLLRGDGEGFYESAGDVLDSMDENYDEPVPIKLYAAYRSTPDFHSHGPTFISAHLTFEGAKKAIYPLKDYDFTPEPSGTHWTGPDGYGLISVIEVQA